MDQSRKCSYAAGFRARVTEAVTIMKRDRSASDEGRERTTTNAFGLGSDMACKCGHCILAIGSRNKSPRATGPPLQRQVKGIARAEGKDGLQEKVEAGEGQDQDNCLVSFDQHHFVGSFSY